MRKRKRPDWRLTVYQYWCEPHGELPQAVWDLAHEMQRQWNALAELLATRRQAAEQAKGQIDWVEFRVAAQHLIKAAPLNWEQGPDVLNRFFSVLKRFKTGGGFPRSHYRLDSWQIPHQYTEGGKPAAALYSPANRRFALMPVPARAYATNHRDSRRLRITRARFGIGDQSIALNVILHRPLPENAIVKKVALVAHHSPLGWKYSIAITCEIPPLKESRQPGGAACGIDLGWRKFDDYLRIGMVYDGQGYRELQLPLYAPTARTKRAGFPCGWPDLETYGRKRSEILEQCKLDIKPALLEAHDDIVTSFHLVGTGGLRKLARRVHESLPAVAVRIELCRLETQRILRLENRLRMRLIGRRRALYQQIALDLCGRYPEIHWEGDLGLKRMAEDKTSDPAFKYSAQYRTWASLYEFRHWLKNAAAKTGTKLVGVAAKDTTSRCSLCGATVQDDLRKLVVRCSNGHEFDQDQNAARNLAFAQAAA